MSRVAPFALATAVLWTAIAAAVVGKRWDATPDPCAVPAGIEFSRLTDRDRAYALRHALACSDYEHRRISPGEYRERIRALDVPATPVPVIVRPEGSIERAPAELVPPVNSAPSNGATSWSARQAVDQLRNEGGWIGTNEQYLVERDLFVTGPATKNLREQYQHMFELTRVGEGGRSPPRSIEHPTLAGMKGDMDRFRAAVEQLAPSWIMSGRDCSGYACELAARAIASHHPKARIMRVTLDGEWFVKKHELTSVPISREELGYVLYQVPGEQWCQLRGFSWFEAYAAGEYQVATGVILNFVRVQQCR